jgi:hypothetical protein
MKAAAAIRGFIPCLLGFDGARLRGFVASFGKEVPRFACTGGAFLAVVDSP